MLKKQRETEGEVLVSTVLFDHNVEALHDRVPLEKVPEITEKDCYVRGCTSMLDAAGGAIHHLGNIHKYAREEDRPEKTIFVITTDGMENASRQYSYNRVKQMVERQKEKYGWEFLFLGANIDAIKTAGRFGISADRAANYHRDHEGTALNYEVFRKPSVQCAAALPRSVGAGRNASKRTLQNGERRINKQIEEKQRIVNDMRIAHPLFLFLLALRDSEDYDFIQQFNYFPSNYYCVCFFALLKINFLI